MNRHVNAISGRLSLRRPQRNSPEIPHRITEIAPPLNKVDWDAALATGVGNTRLMGAFRLQCDARWKAMELCPDPA